MAKFQPKILLVDDERESRAGLARALRGKGFEVAEAESGEEALWRAKGEWPTLIILDIVLPDIPGTEVFERLRQDPLTQAIPVLLLTAKPDVAAKIPSSYGAADRTFEKPGRLDDLMAMIHSMLAGRK